MGESTTALCGFCGSKVMFDVYGSFFGEGGDCRGMNISLLLSLGSLLFGESSMGTGNGKQKQLFFCLGSPIQHCAGFCG